MLSESITHRRSFVGRAAALAAGLLAGGAATTPVLAQRRASQDRSEHDRWMDAVPGKHRQIFHAFVANDIPMLMAKNFLDSYRESFGAKAGEVGAVVGMHGPALVAGLGDAAWERYAFGAQHSITDATTKEPARRNIFRSTGPWAIEALQKEGVVFLLCNTAMRMRAKAIADRDGGSADGVYETMKSAMLPGMVLVPALVVAMNRAQERGFTYVRAS